MAGAVAGGGGGGGGGREGVEGKGVSLRGVSFLLYA